MLADDGRVVSNFINQALKGEAITIYGDGQQTRSFCYISDLIEGIYTLMDINYQKPINIGNPEEFTINELANNIINKINAKSRIIYKPLPDDDPLQRKPDIRFAKKSWRPQ